MHERRVRRVLWWAVYMQDKWYVEISEAASDSF